MKKVAITGASGFIGRHLLGFLKERGYDTKALVHEKTVVEADEVVRGDLVTGEGLDEFLRNVDVLIHLAARQLPPEEEMFRDNIQATNSLINVAIRHNLSQIIYSSTIVVYGEGVGKIVSEVDEPRPNTTYGVTKYLGENLVHFWGTRTGKPVTILRPFNVYGPGNRKGVVYNFYKSFEDEGKIAIFGDGRQKRDFLYVDDLLHAILASVEKKTDGVFNLGIGKSVSLLELVDLFAKIVGKKPQVGFQDAESGKVNKLEYSTEKSETELNWTPAVSLKDGLRRTIQWYQQNP